MDKDDFYKEYTDNFKDNLKVSSDLYLHIHKILMKQYKEGVPFVSTRLKAWESLWNKIDSANWKYKSIYQMGDLIGIRIICLTNKEVAEVVEILKENLSIHKEYDTKSRLGENEFGYSSIHLLGKITEEEAILIKDEDKGILEGKKYEIQVRTMASHIFSDLSHKYDYKSSKFIPSEIRRSLFRIAAMSEVLDTEIDNFNAARQDYLDNYTPEPDDQLNKDNVELFLNKKFNDKRDTKELESYNDALIDLENFGIKSIADLSKLLDSNMTEILKLEKKQINYLIEKLGKDDSLVQSIVKQGFLFSNTGTIRAVLAQQFGAVWEKYRTENIDKKMLQELIEKVKNS